ncbi:MAG: hypothetical protein HYX63_05015 [Gammaproteobacteria bacterium]|nr:hypothetical protein [Gammaproteobacteria bacterium]
MTIKPARKRVQAIALGRGATERVIGPLAFETAAQISARPLDEFRTDPTQLANGLNEFQRATATDFICCALANELELASSGGVLTLEAWLTPGQRLYASLEACKRLRITVGDNVALLVGLTGPATLAAQFNAPLSAVSEIFSALVKHFCEAGADLVLVIDPTGSNADTGINDILRTASNIARFHRGLTLGWEPASSLPQPQRVPLASPLVAGAGITTTDTIVAADASIEAVRRWMAITAGS